MAELTPKQIKYREWYQQNRGKVLASKRAQYKDKTSKPKPRKEPTTKPAQTKKTVKNPKPLNAPLSKKADRFIDCIEQLRPVTRTNADIEKLTTRRKLEDIKLARELGLNMDDIE